jgi:dipeptidyl aminopeptidase/acylaminoacyl peptidase
MPFHSKAWSSPTGLRRVCISFGALCLITAAASCGSDSSTGPSDPLSKVQRFIYVSNESGNNQLYTWDDGATALFPASVPGDVEPQSAAGKVVFTSYRISYLNAEIYIANLDGSNATRLTENPGPDYQPSLSPDGSKVIFSSLRSGTSRIWMMNADGTNPTELATGSDEDLSESNARFSPAGGRILFSSPRTNTTQIWVMPTNGGPATQVTHEANGAFDGSWSPDGSSIFYVDGVDRTRIHNIVVATGDVTDYVTDGSDVGDATCTASACIVVAGATSSNKDIVAYVGANTEPIPLLQTGANEYEPAILIP